MPIPHASHPLLALTYNTECRLKSHSARTGNVFSTFGCAVVRHKANDGVVYAIWTLFNYDTALSAVV